MIINLSEQASNAMLDVLSELMAGGRIELMSDQSVIAALKLASPAAMAAIGGEMEFNEIAEGTAQAQGTIETARIVAADGTEILSCDVGSEKSDAVVKLNTTKIARGAPVRLKSFRLAVP